MVSWEYRNQCREVKRFYQDIERKAGFDRSLVEALWEHQQRAKDLDAWWEEQKQDLREGKEPSPNPPEKIPR